jgi:hypothetical protein
MSQCTIRNIWEEKNLMTQEIEVEKDNNGKKFVKKHWKIVTAFVAAGILAFTGAVYVFLWFVTNAQSTGFILHGAFWELVLIGIPVAIGAILGWQWWKRLPEEEKEQHNLFGKRSRSSRAGGAISPLLFIAFAIKVYVDGNWNVAISTWTLDYVVGSMITILVWTIAIFAIPAIIGIIWWISHEINKKP